MKMISRRDVLRTGAASAAYVTLGTEFGTRGFAMEANEPVDVYVGTYTGADGRGEGIYHFTLSPSNGALTERKLAASTVSPSWIALHPSKKFLYAANEAGPGNGSVSAFLVERGGGLRKLNSVNSQGAAPCHLSFDASGKFVFVANYMSGTLAVFPIEEDGKLHEASDVQHHSGANDAPNGATNGPTGAFTTLGHDAAHAHFIHQDVQGKFVLAVDLGQDKIYTYRFDATAGKLIPHSTTSIPTGDGPRHLAFHPNGKWIYLVTEQASTVTFFHYSPEAGSLTSLQTLSTLPDGFAGTTYGSELTMHPNGKWLYATNRLHDSIAVYEIQHDGQLQHVSQTHTGGDYPRHTNIDPSGRYFYVCNQKGDNIPSFRIDQHTGTLELTGHYAAVGTPACILFG